MQHFVWLKRVFKLQQAPDLAVRSRRLLATISSPKIETPSHDRQRYLIDPVSKYSVSLFDLGGDTHTPILISPDPIFTSRSECT